MPAISTSEQIPNLPLNGGELACYALACLESVCRARNTSRYEKICLSLSAALSNDWVFKSQFTYPNVTFSIAVRTHLTTGSGGERFAFSLEPEFKFPNQPPVPLGYPVSRPFVRLPVGTGAPPIDEYRTEDEHTVDCFTISVKVDNPNLVRVHHRMPVLIQNKVPPKHGELMGKIENHEVLYDPSDYPPLAPPMVTEESEAFVAKWQVPRFRLAVHAHVSEIGTYEDPPVLAATPVATSEPPQEHSDSKSPKRRDRGVR